VGKRRKGGQKMSGGKKKTNKSKQNKGVSENQIQKMTASATVGAETLPDVEKLVENEIEDLINKKMKADVTQQDVNGMQPTETTGATPEAAGAGAGVEAEVETSTDDVENKSSSSTEAKKKKKRSKKTNSAAEAPIVEEEYPQPEPQPEVQPQLVPTDTTENFVEGCSDQLQLDQMMTEIKMNLSSNTVSDLSAALRMTSPTDVVVPLDPFTEALAKKETLLTHGLVMSDLPSSSSVSRLTCSHQSLWLELVRIRGVEGHVQLSPSPDLFP
jgi:hypothetical protein